MDTDHTVHYQEDWATEPDMRERVVSAWLVVTATIVVSLNVVADVVAARLDPRIRLE